MTEISLKMIVEALLMSAIEPLNIEGIQQAFSEQEKPSRQDIRTVLDELCQDYQPSSLELIEKASGWQFQTRKELSPWIQRLHAERPAKYSRAFMETLAIIAYRQPVSRGDIENIRGVATNSNVMRALLEREWIKVNGYRDVPGKPALYVTTAKFLDDFNIKNLEELPPLSTIEDISEATLRLKPESEINEFS